MNNRKKRKDHQLLKISKYRISSTFILKSALLFLIIGSSVTNVFANQDISSLLANWLTKQKDTAIEEIRGAIDTERDIQLGRIQSHLQTKMQSAEESMRTFTANEKSMRVNDLRNYADQMISNLVIDTSENEAAIRNEIEMIFQHAVAQMELVGKMGPPPQLPPIEVNKPDIKQEEKPIVKEPDSKPVEQPAQKEPETNLVEEPNQKDPATEPIEEPIQQEPDTGPVERNNETGQAGGE